jgi:multiple sugar transport system permease protein
VIAEQAIRHPRRRLRLPQSRRGTVALLELPSVLVVVAITLFPVLYSLNISFRSFSLTLPGHTGQWVGLDNYIRLLTDSAFFHAVWLIAVFTVVGVTIELALGLLIALVLDGLVTGRRLFTSLLLIPMILTPVVIGLMFNFVFNAQFGLFDYLIQALRIPLPHGILASSATAFAALVGTDIWEWTPFMALVLLAGLQALPSEPFEAARVDGASAWQTLRWITLPMLRPLIAVAILFRSAEAIKEFDKVFLLTAGGPGNATEVVDLFTYHVAFMSWDLSYGAALGMVLFTISMLVGAGFFKLLASDVGTA